MKKFSIMKRIIALLIVFGMVTGLVPVAALEGIGATVAHAAEESGSYELNNGYLKVTVSPGNGGFGIRTVEGDKTTKSDNDQYLVFEYDEDNTSFTSFQVTRNGVTKEYIFGGRYPGSSGVTVTREVDDLVATWSVADLTFRQVLTLVKSGSNEHGTVQISYEVENNGAPAQIKARILMDTALGYQDYAYYRIGKDYLERETALDADDYSKSFYAVTDTGSPRIVAYTINGSIDNRECAPYRTVFAHWNNLASTVFDYTPDENMTFTNFNNAKYLTSDSAYAQYFDLGEVAEGGSGSIVTNYGVYSNESVEDSAAMAVNINAPDVIQYAENADGSENCSAYENDGVFSVRTHIKNISPRTYSDIRIVVTTAGCIGAMDQLGADVESSYDNPHSMLITDVTVDEQLDIDWTFRATPRESGQYSRIHYKVYDVSEAATQGTGQILQQNLLGEGYSYILCPGSVTSIPELKFTATSPETLYSAGVRTLNILGDNFSMLLDKSAYALKLSRVDGMAMDGNADFTIPAEKFQIDDSTNVITMILDDEVPGNLPEGRYQLTLDYTDATKADISGPALQFDVSNDETFRNDCYGFLAVMRGSAVNSERIYFVQTFGNEDDYWTQLDDNLLSREDVLLEFRGNFIAEEKEDGSVVYTGISNNGSHNVMTLNGCLDIYDGTCTITDDDGSVKVDFDADLYTTGSGTYVHSGVAALTELERGEEYELIPYSEDGEREFMTGETIALLWPSVGRAFQSLAGLLFDLRFGELGVIAHEGAEAAIGSETRVVAFGAAMDLSFLIPAGSGDQYIVDRAGKTKDILGSSYDAAEHNSIQFSPDEIRALNARANYRTNVANTDATADDANSGAFSDMTVDDTAGYNAFSVTIDDILFGGEYLGVNMELALGIPPYIMGMPALEGLLSIHTVGDWSFGVEGQCHFTGFSMEASIYILNHDGFPIVDELSFFIGGFTPGINVDGVGVLWLQGGGGGIENVYDTIFLTDTIPPLKLILKCQFSIMQIFSAVASMGISLRGLSLDISNGMFSEYEDQQAGITIVPQPITMDASLQIDWYPEFFFLGAVNMALARIITGGGYVVADHTGFYEFFLRAGVQIPGDVPIIGGYEVADMNLGVSTERIWGKMTWLEAISIALIYYWGGEIDWNNGESVYPTYPELVGMEGNGSSLMSIPVDYDEKTGKTLMMEVGSNITVSAASGLKPIAVNGAEGDLIQSEAVSGSLHTMRLVPTGSGKILSIQWTSENETTAKAEAQSVVIADQVNSINQIPLKLWSVEDPEGANANLSYNSETKTAYLSVAFGADHEKVYDSQWNITTPEGALLVVYDVAPLPEVEVTSAEVSGSQLVLALEETITGSFTQVTVVAEGTDGQTYLLGGASNLFSDGIATLTLPIPEQASSDTYTLRIVCKDDTNTNYHEANAEFAYVNPNQPAAPSGVTAAGAGDYKVSVSAAVSGDYDGLQFTAIDANGNVVSGMESVLLNKDGSPVSYDENGVMLAPESTNAAASYLIGGHFEQAVENEEGVAEQLVTGLSAGTYTIRVRSFKRVAGNAAVLLSEAAQTTVTVRTPVRTEIAITGFDASSRAGTTLTETVNGVTSSRTVFTTGDVLLQLSAAESFSGKWTLDGGYLEGNSGTVAEGTTAMVSLSGLTDGNHRFHFVGKNAYGDSTEANYVLTVDTLGPRLLLAEPVNGSLFSYKTGALDISGITDENTILTVLDNTTRTTVHQGTSVLSVDEAGRFSQTVTLDTSVLNHDLTIRLTDPYGNTSSKDVSVMSNALGSIESIKLVSSDRDVTNTKLTAGSAHSLVLVATLKDSNQEVILNGPGMVDWNLDVLEGDASITNVGDGIRLTTTAQAEGMITGRFLVSSEGSYPVCAVFGYTGEELPDLGNSMLAQIQVSDQYYTGSSVTPAVSVWYDGEELTEGVDYTITGYSNNVEVTTAEDPARVVITGMGRFTGTLTGYFQISYLEMSDSMLVISGVSGSNGYYVSDVTFAAAQGYELVLESGSAPVLVTAEGQNSLTFRVRRLSDGAMTDVVNRTVSVDKTAPTGTITLDETVWSRILGVVTFGGYKVDNLSAEVTASDNIAVASVEYAIGGTAYGSVTDLENAQLTWAVYSDSNKPTIRENENQVIYVRITDVAGHVTYLASDEVFVDTLAPVVSVASTGATADSVNFAITTSEAGKIYYAVRKATEPAPTAAELMAGTGVRTVTAEEAGTAIALSVSGLEEITAYIVYAMAEDTVVMLSDGTAVPNVSEVVASAAVTTNPDKYMEMDDSMIVVTGVLGDNGYYVSDVTIAAAEGYMLVLEDGSTTLQITTEGTTTVTFHVRRISDGAATGPVTRTLSIDKTAPTGTIHLDERVWDRILGTVTFGGYKVRTMTAEVTASDNIGVAAVAYAISNAEYSNVTDLENAQLTWEVYSESSKPTIRENENQVIYVRITDVAGHVTYLASDEIFVDTLAPVVSVAVTDTTEASLTFRVTTSEAGKIYYAVRLAADPAPTAAELMAGTGIRTVTAEEAGQPISVTVRGLVDSTSYVVYVVAEDTVVMLSDGTAAPNVSEVVASEPAATNTPGTTVEGLFRLKGKNRYLTGMAIANELKEVLGVEKFSTVVVAYGEKFPDALTGSYLAAIHNAPILLTDKSVDDDVLNFIRQNLVEGGKVYILGGTAAVSQTFEDSAKSYGFDVERLKGKNRYETNLAILAEAGVDTETEILIATGANYADSLSASATGLPMLLVDKALTAQQKAFLEGTSKKFAILGGTAAVSADIEAALAKIGTVERVKGASRYETSVVIAQRYFTNPGAIVLAYGEAFPDGLCGGPLAIQVGAPLILTHNDKLAAADAYVQNVGYGYVTGGTARLSDAAVREIFDVSASAEIVVKE